MRMKEEKMSNYELPEGIRKVIDRRVEWENREDWPEDYWDDLNNVIYAVQVTTEGYLSNEFPRAQKLNKVDPNLPKAIREKHGGYKEIKKILRKWMADRSWMIRLHGEAKRRPDGFWQNEGVVIAYARKIKDIHKFDRLPGATELRRLGYDSFVYAVKKYYNGLDNFKRMIGEIPRDNKDLKYVTEQAAIIMEEHGFDELPGQNVLRRLGYGGLVDAIKRYHSGFDIFRARLKGEEPPMTRSQKGIEILEGLLGDEDE